MRLLSSRHAQHQIGLHLVWCPKYRHAVLTGAIEVVLREILAETCVHYGWGIESLEIVPDHVHIFVQTDHWTRPVEVASTLKSISAVKLFSSFPKLKSRKFWGSGLWSPSTYYGSVGQVNEATIRKYIELQKSRDAIHPRPKS